LIVCEGADWKSDKPLGIKNFLSNGDARERTPGFFISNRKTGINRMALKPAVFVFAILMGLAPFMALAEAPNVSPAVAAAFQKANFPLLGSARPPGDFTLTSLSGDTVTLSALKGQVVFLNFWATWCPPCRKEMPSMEVLYQRFRGKGLQMLAVDIQEKEAGVRRFIQEQKLNFPVLLDTSGKVSGGYGIEAVPTTFIIGRDGAIIARMVGSTTWNSPEMVAAFESLLSDRR
jgi:peroxiredoxin